MNDIIYDIETYPNAFTLCAEHAHLPITWQFEISDRKDQSEELIAWLRNTPMRMVGFNNLGFDYPVIHTLMRMGKADANTLYQKAMAIISSQDSDRWAHMVYPSDRYVEQIDLYKIHHFDNVARATSLKTLEFNMRSESVEDLPFPVGTRLTHDQIDLLLKYNAHDVSETKRFYHQTLDMIRFREELTHKYQRDFMNHNDTKIGKDYFQMKLEEAGVVCYEYGPDGRAPVQTRRDFIQLKDCILPNIQFQQPELTRVLNWFKDQTITETKGVFKDINATIGGFTFVFGLGGIHGSIESEVVESDEDYIIEDWDVASYYPNLAIANQFYPEHLGKTFCEVYKHLYEQRKNYPKGSAENAMLKLALNGVYGDSNNKFSIFYDPKFTMSITLNGQLLLCLLAENLLRIPELRLIQVNTDGLTIRYPRKHQFFVHQITQWWQDYTRLTLESAEYSRMFIRDVNNYIAEYDHLGGKVKRKGAYEYKLSWHQNASALVVPKVAERHLLYNQPIRDTIMDWTDPMDFMLRAKVPRSSRLVITSGNTEQQVQNTTRYYISNEGGYLYKLMPPTSTQLKQGKTDERRIALDSGWQVTIANTIPTTFDINYEYYIQEVEKLCLALS